MSIFNSKQPLYGQEASIAHDTKSAHTSFEPLAPLSPFSTPSPDDSNMQFSYEEDLSNSFDDTCLNELQDSQDYDNAPPSVESISLDQLLHSFPDLPSFIYHPFFVLFSDIWLEFQKYTALAKEPSNRSYVQSWLTSTALQIHYHMVTLVKSSAEQEDPESSSRKLFSAFRILKDRIEIMHQVFQIIEMGRTLGQSPTEAIAPLVETAVQIRKDVAYFNDSSTAMIPVIGKDEVNLVRPDQVSMADFDSHVMNTYNLMPYNNFSTTAANNLISNTCIQQDSSNMNPIHAPYSFIQPSWMHFHDGSLPVTPSQSSVQYNQFMSLPTSPTCAQEVYSVDQPARTPCNSVQDMTLSPYKSNSPLNNTSEANPSEDDDNDYDMDLDDDDLNSMTVKEEYDDEYIASDVEEEDMKENKIRRRSKRTKVLKPGISITKSRINAVTTKDKRPVAFERQYTRRTATSYDSETTHYLKSIFFDIYSNNDKLTKDQRRQVQRETGLKPRNITYWFSNHKRRFQNSLLVYKKIVTESKGSVKNYNDFLLWRRSRGLSEEVLENEHLQIIDDLDHSQDENDDDEV
ncbi:hypothetical protein EDC94DRAFT_686132 [Helicostylum pulchrum]|nr:hypothetical protein EDC94DRAFT_686132 [Helicostylum pulchrum]